MEKVRTSNMAICMGLAITGMLFCSCENSTGQTLTQEQAVNVGNNEQNLATDDQTLAQNEQSVSEQENETWPRPFRKEVPNNFRIDENGANIGSRFINLDDHYERIPGDDYGNWLLNLPLKPYGAPCIYFDKLEKDNSEHIHLGVLKMDLIGSFDKNGKEHPADLQQCADACMRLRAEYLWQKQMYDKIHFKGSNGFVYDYSKWAAGYRIHFAKNGNESWSKDKGEDYSYKTFRQFMSIVYTYCGTASLSKELVKVKPEDVRPGDILILGGHPGHAETVMDVLRKKDGTAVKVMLTQSYMPAQEIEVLANWRDNYSPWYEVNNNTESIYTPQFHFGMRESSFMRWVDR